jgi:RHS repeat-associated protein
VGGIEYKNATLEAMYHAEGRAYRTINKTWQYEYTLKDHLGNSRVTFADLDNNGTINPLAEILQENHYYPFGLNQEGKWLNNAVLPDTKYQYNGKELNEDLGLNWNHQDARFYDFAINRWSSVDPITEGQEDFSPYHFSYDNPIRFSDPNGKEPDGCCGGIIDDAIAFTAGTLNAIGSNAGGGALRGNPSDFGSSANSAAAGQKLGDAISAVGGAVTAVGALLSAGAAAVGTVGSGGATAIAVAPALAVAGAATLTAVNGAKNLTQGDRVYSQDELKIKIDSDKKIDRDLLEPPTKYGNAPTFKSDKTAVEIHHEGQKREGPFTELHWKEHRGKGNDAINHPNKHKPSEVDRKEFDKAKRNYWKEEYPKSQE